MLAHPSVAVWCSAAASPLLIAALLAWESGAAEPSESPRRPGVQAMLVQPEELQKDLHQPQRRVLDTRALPQYVKAHIPGAVWVDVRRWQQLGGREGGFH